MNKRFISISVLSIAIMSSLLQGCSKTAGTSEPSLSAEELEKQQMAKTETMLKGRWQCTFAEDWIFGDGGVFLTDGPGPLDVTGKYEVIGPDRIVLHLPASSPGSELTTYFFEDKLRLTVTDGIGKDWDGRTLTKK